MDVAVPIRRNMKNFPNLPVCISTGSSPTPSYTDGHRSNRRYEAGQWHNWNKQKPLSIRTDPLVDRQATQSARAS